MNSVTIRTMPRGWRLLRPIVLTVGYDPGEVIVWDEAGCMYGQGATLRAAVQDYKASLTDVYRWDEAGKQSNRPGVYVFHQWLSEHVARGEGAAAV